MDSSFFGRIRRGKYQARLGLRPDIIRQDDDARRRHLGWMNACPHACQAPRISIYQKRSASAAAAGGKDSGRRIRTRHCGDELNLPTQERKKKKKTSQPKKPLTSISYPSCHADVRHHLVPGLAGKDWRPGGARPAHVLHLSRSGPSGIQQHLPSRTILI